MKTIVLFFLASTLLATSHATSCLSNPIRLRGETALEDSINPNPIHVPRPKPRSGGPYPGQIDCLSWRLAVETNNLRNWFSIPSYCIGYVAYYMLGTQYRKDCEFVADIAIKYAQSVTPAGDGKDIWVFDVDETVLSNLPFFARPDVAFGIFPISEEKFNEWIEEGNLPAVPAVPRLYNKLYELGFKVVFLTGGGEKIRESRASNLRNVGYTTWEDLILKGDADSGETTVEYKSKKRTELVAKGYRIIGNVGDQWSDLTGTNVGSRTFKMPNPMYNVP